MKTLEITDTQEFTPIQVSLVKPMSANASTAARTL